LLTKSLDKEWLEQFNLIVNLETEINRINASHTLNIGLLRPDKLPLEADKQLILFRIIQEALQNAVRHSGANKISISIEVRSGIIDMSIKDNGKGFISDGNTTGMGIRNMKHRAALLKGSVEWGSTKEGSSVLISVPINERPNEN